MSRILFAAARGARIQRLWFKHKGAPYNWGISRVLSVANESDYDYRIHPDDAHLQYGPISTSLRENALDDEGPFPTTAVAPFGHWWMNLKDNLAFDDAAGVECDPNLQRSLFLLILAEALADEGL